jgi:tetratricopeptide (TPR) repeat protein/transcriptional regulator with XRE-family HTH domain
MFGDIVRRHRRRLGLSQQELADKSGVTIRGLRKIESGQTAAPRPVTVRLLADAFGLTSRDRDQFCAAAHPPTADRAERDAMAPAQLPANVAGFVGRTESLRQLNLLLDRGADEPTAVVVTAVAGAAGIGKTTLAVHWAHSVRDRFPDGQLYIDLRGFDPSGTVMDPVDVIRRFLDALAVPGERIPADPGAQADLYRTQLADKTMLIVLDNARDADQVRPLLPGAPGCLVLITGRRQLTSLVAAEGVHQLRLDVLSPDEARELFARRLGADRVRSESDAVDELITWCAGLPLALAIVAANAATHPHVPLVALADRLRRDRLDSLATGDASTTDLRAVLSWSFQALSEDAVQLFRLLGLHPGPDISAAAAASLAALPIDQVRSLLSELARANLIDEHASGRFRLHDLLNAYAADLALTLDSEEQRHAATGRLLDHYLHSAYTAALLLMPAREAIGVMASQPGVTPEHWPNHEQAFAWLAAERAVLLAAVDHAAATGFDSHTWQLAWTLYDFLDRRGHWHDLAATQRAAIAAAGRLGDASAQARAYRYLAHAHMQLGRFEDAHSQLGQALDLYREVGDLIGQAHAHHTFSSLWERQAGYAQALDHARQSLDLFSRAGDQVWRATALNGIGWYHALLGDHEQAITWCEQALSLLQELDDQLGQSATWDSLGYAHHHLGDYDQAIICYQHALDLVRDLGDRYYEAVALTHLGQTHQVAGDSAGARDTWQHALSILDELQHPDADQVRAKLRDLDRHGAAQPSAPVSEPSGGPDTRAGGG